MLVRACPARLEGVVATLVASAGLLASVMLPGCKGSTQAVDGRSNFVEDGVAMDAPDDWNGERITIQNAGVTPAGGLDLSAPGTGRVQSTARMLAVANTLDKASADQAILSATQTYLVTTNGGVTSVQCGHGGTFGSADAAESGCDALDVSVPSGAPDKLVSVSATSGNGNVVVSFEDVQLAQLEVQASFGFADVSIQTTKGATVSVVNETGGDITLRLAGDFAADVITLDSGPGQIDTTAFPDVLAGKGRGAAGTGAKSIALRSGVAGGVRGRIVLVAR